MIGSDMLVGGLRRRHFIAALAVGCLAGGEASAWGAPPRTILVVGDSLSAEYGLKRGEGWVALLQKRLDDRKMPVKVVNASISGDTTSGGRSRLPALLAQHKPDIVVIELGGNDALRGLPVAMTQDNLSRMTEDAQKAGARVLIVGVQVPPNYGTDYANKFAAVFAQVAKAHKALVVPSLMAGFGDAADSQRWFQGDRIHPIAEAHPRILDTIWAELKKLIA